MGRLVGLLGQGVGLAMEYRQHRAQQNSEPSNSHTPDQSRSPSEFHDGHIPMRPRTPLATNIHNRPQSSQYRDMPGNRVSNDYSPIEKRDSDWDIDDPPSYEDVEQLKRSPDDLAREVVAINNTRSTIQSSFQRRPLPCPVIIPQRRPGSKDRGFMRAYAPLLGECAGIDRETFLSFLKNFHKSSQASPIFGIVQVSAGIAGFAPSAIAMAVTTAVGVAASKGAEIQKNSRTNGYLDKMNQELFIPAGLYAMIVQYQPNADDNSRLGRLGVSGATTELDTTQAIATRMDGNSQRIGLSGNKFGVASGRTSASTIIQDSAPLVYPEQRSAPNSGQAEIFKDKTKDFKKFMDGYMDRKAQAKYARENPGSSLAVPDQQSAFKSKYSDPNHPMFNSGLVGLVSGGQLSRDRSTSPRPEDERVVDTSDDSSSSSSCSRRFDDKKARRNYEKQARNEDRRGGRRRGDEKSDDEKEKRSMKEGVLYLMIVNMPSELELAQANRQMARAPHRP